MWTETHGIALVVYHLVPTSNHNYREENNGLDEVVYHLVPTSNHNGVYEYGTALLVVYHLVPTSNHNCGVFAFMEGVLFIILFLHQTTTVTVTSSKIVLLFIILFLHQTTTEEMLNVVPI